MDFRQPRSCDSQLESCVSRPGNWPSLGPATGCLQASLKRASGTKYTGLAVSGADIAKDINHTVTIQDAVGRDQFVFVVHKNSSMLQNGREEGPFPAVAYTTLLDLRSKQNASGSP